MQCYCWSPNGPHIAYGSEDEAIIVWDADSVVKLINQLGHPSFKEQKAVLGPHRFCLQRVMEPKGSLTP